MSILSSTRVLGVAAGALLALGGACTEPKRVDQTPVPAAPPHASLTFSDSAPPPGATVVVSVRVDNAPIASATGRLVFDTTAVAFVGEEANGDGVTRATNASGGAVRFAAMSASAIPDGRVASVRFSVLRPNGLRTIHVAFDEAHTPARADLRRALEERAP